MTGIDRRVGPDTRRFAVLGEHLSHTWSPYLHNTLFAAGGVDAIYLPLPFAPEHLPAAVQVLRDAFAGFNVTIPYKQQILPFLDEVDAAAQALGAVNTVENRGGKLIGHNTDGAGMMRAISEAGIPTKGQSALVLGGGGAARAAIYQILSRDGECTVALRHPEKGEAILRDFAGVGATGHLHLVPLSQIDGCFDLIINCTPCGMHPNEVECPVTDTVLSRCGAVFDAVYNPRETQLLARARAYGMPTAEGLGMLFWQAVEAERFWLDHLPAEEKVTEIYQSFLNEF